MTRRDRACVTGMRALVVAGYFVGAIVLGLDGVSGADLAAVAVAFLPALVLVLTVGWVCGGEAME